MTIRDDTLGRTELAPDRPFYAPGLMLGAEDFTAEQLYHRARLARTLAYLHGGGTIAGLVISHRPASGTTEEQLRVGPGLAVDRLGRMIEVPRPWCLPLARWYAAQEEDVLDAAVFANVPITGEPDPAAVTPPPALTTTNVSGVVADVFIRFVNCDRAKTPAFQTGAFDALDAVVPARVRDAFDVTLAPRTDLLLPADPLGDLGGIADVPARRAAWRWRVLRAWREPGNWGDELVLTREPEHPTGVDPSSLFLGRIVIPADATAGAPTRRNEPVAVDNYARRFVPSGAALASWLGL